MTLPVGSNVTADVYDAGVTPDTGSPRVAGVVGLLKDAYRNVKPDASYTHEFFAEAADDVRVGDSLYLPAGTTDWESQFTVQWVALAGALRVCYLQRAAVNWPSMNI